MAIAAVSQNSIQPNPENKSADPAEETPSPLPYPLCPEPRQVPVHDEVLELCYELNLPCGVSTQTGIERFRRTIWSPPPPPTTPSNETGLLDHVYELGSGLGDLFRRGLNKFLGN